MSIALIGYRGSGKTTTGRRLADRLWQSFVDTDELVVRKAGKTIRDIFAEKGESGFRDLEAGVVGEVCKLPNHVVALGGGAVLREENRRAIKDAGMKVIYLRCEPDELAVRIAADPETAATRPSLSPLGGGVEEVRKMLAEREPIYRAMMTGELDVTHLSPQDAVVYLSRLVQRPRMAQHALYITFVFALGACVGSFLNVVVWRLPRVEHKEGEGLLRSFYRSYHALSFPASHCPKCDKPLKWYDNLPVIGWIKLAGKCRFCREPISPRYPIVEAITGAIFVLYYVSFFILQVGPCPTPTTSPAMLAVPRDLWVYFLYMALAAALLAASLIDAELFIIPLEIPYVIAVIGFVVHAIFGHPSLPGALNLVDAGGAPSIANALAAGGLAGLAVSLFLFWRGVIPISFPNGEPILEVDRPALEEEMRLAKRERRDLPPLPPAYPPKAIRAEIRKEILFLLPPMAGAVLWMVLTTRVEAVGRLWAAATQHDAVTSLLGAVLGALVGAWLVWIVRILGTLGFGRVAMGLGDVHLMFGVGAVIGSGPVVIAFFLAPFFGILLAIYRMLSRKHQELPYGPYLSLGTGAVMLFYCPIADYFRPGLEAMTYFATIYFLNGEGG